MPGGRRGGPLAGPSAAAPLVGAPLVGAPLVGADRSTLPPLAGEGMSCPRAPAPRRRSEARYGYWQGFGHGQEGGAASRRPHAPPSFSAISFRPRFSASPNFAGSVPPPCAMLGRPPPLPPHALATSLISLPAWTFA